MAQDTPRPAAARFRPSDVVDFVIVGSGAAGGIIAKELSTAGFTVVVLEQGPRLTEQQFDHDEFGAFFRSINANDPVKQPQTFRATPQDQAVKSQAAIYGQLVGGSNAHFTGNYWRLRPSDFNEASTLGGVSGTAFTDWPITYDDLEPYYTKVDWEIGVSGIEGPFDPRRSKPYPMPPLPVKSSGVLMDKACAALGLHSQPAPMAINSVYYNGRPACQHCGFCLFFMCEFRSKSTSMVTMIPVAEATGKCEVRPNSYVAKVEVGFDGRARGVSYFDAQKRMQLQRAKAVVLCANGSETPRLLLNSATSRFKDGLANSSGIVGKHLMFNTYCGVNAQFEHPLNEHKSVQNTRIMLDFYETDPKRGFYGGGGLDARFGKYPITFALGGLPPGSPMWGEDFARGLAEQYTRSMYFACHGTSLPLEQNSVSIDPILKDAWGLPAMRVTYKDHPDDLKNAEFLSGKAMEIAKAAGALKAWPDPIGPQTNSVHLLGTCRMGNDPTKSVVDRFNRTHDVRNLFICDGSSLVTSTRGQPTMTISALAFRAGENIAAFAKRGEKIEERSMWNRRQLLAAGLLAPLMPAPLSAQRPSSDDLNATLQRQTQELMDAIATGIKAPWQRYLADAVVLVDENGKRSTKADIVGSIRAFPPEIWGRIRVVDFDLVRHDRVAITTWVADEDEGYYGQVIHARYKNTDTWLETNGQWQLIAQQVQALRDDPPSIDLSFSALDAYVGTYALTPAVSYVITREGTELRGERTGRTVETIKVEMPDVLFVPGQPRLRKIFKRDEAGRISGFVERRETWDIAWGKTHA